ncbi:MAG: recombinase family protein [Lachnospiraceae bacterium]|nr:recombinase family protein [Lachnospiraceae bacterium]
MTRNRTYPLPSNGEKTARWIPYGYLYDPDAPALIAIDPEASNTVRYIFEEYLKGISLSEICRMLTEKGVPTPSDRRAQLGAAPAEKSNTYWKATALNQMLFHPVYAGDWILEGRVWDCCYYYSGIPYPNGITAPVIEKDHHEALVPRDYLVKAAQMFLEQRKERNTIQQKPFTDTPELSPFSILNLLRCGICGRFLTPAEISLQNGKGFTAYFCSSINQKKPGDCSNYVYRLDTLLSLVHEILSEERKNALRFSQTSSKRSQDKTYTVLEAEFQEQIDQTIDEVRSLIEEQNKLERSYKTHGISQEEYDRLSADLAKRISHGEHKVMVALTKIRDFRKLCGEKNAWVSLFANLPEDFTDSSIEYKRYIQKINVFPDQPPVIFLKRMDAKKQLMETLNLPYNDPETDTFDDINKATEEN